MVRRSSSSLTPRRARLNWMDHRIGTCGSCHARFKIPASFTPNRARCRRCNGVVEIGPLVAEPSGGPFSAGRGEHHDEVRDASRTTQPIVPARQVTPPTRDPMREPARGPIRDPAREPTPEPAREPMREAPAARHVPVESVIPRRDAPARIPDASAKPAASSQPPPSTAPTRTSPPSPIERPGARVAPAKKKRVWIPAAIAAVVSAIAALGIWAMSDRGVVTETRAAKGSESKASRVEASSAPSDTAAPADNTAAPASPSSTNEHATPGN